MEIEPMEPVQGQPMDTADGSDSDGDPSDSSSESSSGSDEEVEVDPADMQRMMKLEADLEANPHLYDTHIQYLELLRKCQLHARLRAAHERMASIFPLSENLWTEWVNDELSQVKGPDDVQRILALFERATKDYLSVTLWCSYLEFARDFEPEVQARSTAGLKRLRDLCEAALVAAGLHITEAGKLWGAYRAFELQLESEGAGGDKHTERVRQLFHRQLQVPLADGPAVMEEYKAWEEKHGQTVPAHIAKAFTKAQEAVALRKPYEDAVAPDRPADANLLAAYMSYVRLEQAQGDPARVQCVYERAIAAFPVTHELWAQYGRYLEVHLKAVPALASGAYGRAIRNCYWVGSLWARAMRAAARAVGSADGAGGGGGAALDAALREQAELYQRALQAGLQDYECYMEVILARLDGLRHAASIKPDVAPSLREVFQQASQLLSSYFPDHLDRSLRLPSYWAHCEALLLKDPAAARKVWEDTLVRGSLGRYYEGWAAWAAMERGMRLIKEARAVYKKAYSRKLEEGGQLAICSDWLRFEREEGSPDDLLAASLKVEPIMEEAAAAAAAAADASAAAVAKAAAKQAPQLSKEEVARMRRENDPNFGKRKDKEREHKAPGKASNAAAPAAGAAAERARGASAAAGGAGPSGAEGKAGGAGAKRQREGQHGGDAPADASAKKPRQQAGTAAAAGAGAEPGAAQGGGEQKGKTEAEPESSKPGGSTDGDAHMVDAAKDAAGAGARGGAGAAASETGAADGQDAAAGPSAVYTDERTVFVKGLRMNLQEGELDPVFRKCGDLAEVRLMRDTDGRFRGFAYVEFSSDEGQQKALALNGTPFQGKPLFIAKSRPTGPGRAAADGAAPGQGRGRGRGDHVAGRGGRSGGSDWGHDNGRGRGRGGGRGGGNFGSGFGGGRGGGRGGGDFHGGYQEGRGAGSGAGRAGGRGRGRGGEDGEGGGGRGGRFDGRGGGRGHQGLGFRGGRHDNPDDTAGRGGHHRQQIQLDEGEGAGHGAPAFVSGGVHEAAPTDGAPKSNDEFRKMLLAKK